VYEGYTEHRSRKIGARSNFETASIELYLSARRTLTCSARLGMRAQAARRARRMRRETPGLPPNPSPADAGEGSKLSPTAKATSRSLSRERVAAKQPGEGAVSVT
jgi:hypothetical protein